MDIRIAHIPTMIFKYVPQIQNFLWEPLWTSTRPADVSFQTAETYLELFMFHQTSTYSIKHLTPPVFLISITDNSKPYNHPWLLGFPSISYSFRSKIHSSRVINLSMVFKCAQGKLQSLHDSPVLLPPCPSSVATPNCCFSFVSKLLPTLILLFPQPKIPI